MKYVGKHILCARFGSSGSFEDSNGKGDLSLDGSRPGQTWPHLDLGQIDYANETFENGEENRRLSLTQARYVHGEIIKFLNDRFKHGIPSDEEINGE